MPPKRNRVPDARSQVPRGRGRGAAPNRRRAQPSSSSSRSPSPPLRPEFNRARFVSAYAEELFAARKNKPFIPELAVLPTAHQNRDIYEALTFQGWWDFCGRRPRYNLDMVAEFYVNFRTDEPIGHSWVRGVAVPYDADAIRALYSLPRVEGEHPAVTFAELTQMLGAERRE